MLLLLALACTRTKTVTLVDEGAFCFDSATDTYQVDFQTCLSSSCDTLVETACAVTLEDEGLVVTASATIESVVNGDCTADCGFVQVGCQLPELDDTEGLTVRYGSTTVPLDQVEACGDQPVARRAEYRYTCR